MKSAAWLPVAILIAVVLSLGFSWFLSSPDREYLFDGVRGLTRPEVADWWRIRIPVAFTFGVISSGLLIVLLRTARSRGWFEAAASIAAAILGFGALAGSLYFVRQQALEAVECELPTPQAATDVFLDRQWTALSLAPQPGTRPKIEYRLGPLRKESVGLENHQGFIPFDPFLLERLSFVGLTLDEVESLLGPPLPAKYPDSPSITYEMIGSSRSYQRARLHLSTGTRWERSDTVKAELIRLGQLPRY